MARQIFSAETKVAILKEYFEKQMSVADICEKHRVHPNRFYRWKKRLVEAWAELHAGELAENWELLQAGRMPYKIAPLQ